MDYILRVPPAVVVWHDSYAGSMFEVVDALHRWEGVELRRWREGQPNDASARFVRGQGRRGRQTR